MTEHLTCETPYGPGTLVVDHPAIDPVNPDPVNPVDPESAVGDVTVMLGHGAGGQLEAVDLSALAARLPEHGFRVVRFEQPWRTAGRKVAAPAAQLDVCWLAAVAEVTRRWPGQLITGGRSSGARVACRTASQAGAAGVLALAFPLHPPGRPEKSRLSELLTPTVPVLVCQGTRDTFGDAALVRTQTATADNIEVWTFAGADHSMKAKGPQSRTADDLDQVAVCDQVINAALELLGRVG